MFTNEAVNYGNEKVINMASRKRMIGISKGKYSHKRTAVFVLTYGSPHSKEELKEYMTSIRRGREPSAAEIKELERRYELVHQWDAPQLYRIPNEQAAVLADILDDYDVYFGALHDASSISSDVIWLIEDGYDDAIVIVTAPFHAGISTMAYRNMFDICASSWGLQSYQFIEEWWRQPTFSDYWAAAIKVVKSVSDTDTMWIFSAHSIPIINDGIQRDSYKEDLWTAARIISEKADISNWSVAFQSAPPRPGWMGPSVEESIEAALQKGYKRIVFVPFGFVSNHVEVLYDNDIVCRELVERGGAIYDRVDMPNTNRVFLQAMASAIVERIEQ